MRGSTASLILGTLLLTLFVASSARADLALFRVEQRWHNFPNPPVTTPGGAGLDQGYIQPYATNFTTGKGATYPPATAPTSAQGGGGPGNDGGDFASFRKRPTSGCRPARQM